VDLSTNTTPHLIADIERLRQHHGVESWTVLGMSWGTTLGLAYAQALPQRVKALVLALVTTTSRREVRWLTHDVGRIFLQEWERFAAAVPDTLRHLTLVDAYATVLFDPDPIVRGRQHERGVPGKMRTSRLLPTISKTHVLTIRNFDSGSQGWSRTTGVTLVSSPRINYSTTPQY